MSVWVIVGKSVVPCLAHRLLSINKISINAIWDRVSGPSVITGGPVMGTSSVCVGVDVRVPFS